MSKNIRIFLIFFSLNNMHQFKTTFWENSSKRLREGFQNFAINEVHKYPQCQLYVIFSCQLCINQCLISCSNMIWTFRIFFTFLFALCVEAHLNKVHAKKGPPEVKKFWELYNDKKIKYRLGLCFCWMMSILFKIKFYAHTVILEYFNIKE